MSPSECVETQPLKQQACQAAVAIVELLQCQTHKGSLLIAISGIDGSGKSVFSKEVARELREYGCNVALLSVDDWHESLEKRFSQNNSGEHFYRRGLRLDSMFRDLVLPLRASRTLATTLDVTDVHGVTRPQAFMFRNVDVILLEGIFLLQPRWRGYYHLALWLDCSFETALARALRRNQESLTAEEIIRDYQRIYFAAQRAHFESDKPREIADWIVNNDEPTLAA